jgi:hypothetical protein
LEVVEVSGPNDPLLKQIVEEMKKEEKELKSEDPDFFEDSVEHAEHTIEDKKADLKGNYGIETSEEIQEEQAEEDDYSEYEASLGDQQQEREKSTKKPKSFFNIWQKKVKDKMKSKKHKKVAKNDEYSEFEESME